MKGDSRQVPKGAHEFALTSADTQAGFPHVRAPPVVKWGFLGPLCLQERELHKADSAVGLHLHFLLAPKLKEKKSL